VLERADDDRGQEQQPLPLSQTNWETVTQIRPKVRGAPRRGQTTGRCALVSTPMVGRIRKQLDTCPCGPEDKQPGD
jgi:hypothetical protein